MFPSAFLVSLTESEGFPGGASGKEPTCQCKMPMQKMHVGSLGQEDPLEEGLATHSSILAWRIPVEKGAWCAYLVRLQSMG